MVFAKGLRPLQVVAVILLVRILSVFVVQTWFVPDEYWQTLEVAHKEVFGYGALTWEWRSGIRSYLYPSVVAALYTVLKFTGLDYPEALLLSIYLKDYWTTPKGVSMAVNLLTFYSAAVRAGGETILPRILQALLSTAADYSFYKWTGGRKWALFLVLTSWFWFYTASRTLLQTVETALVAIALSIYPFNGGYYDNAESPRWIWLAVVCVFLRPTSAPLWAVLGAYNLLTTNQTRLRLVVRTYVPIALIAGGALVALDSYYYGSLVVTPWEFFKYNVLFDIATFYGEHPWYWYLTHGLPAVLGINVLPVLWATGKILRRPKENKIGTLLLLAVALYVGVHSAVPHKEFRFVAPLLPIFMYLAQDVIVPWSRKAKNWQLYLMAGGLLVGNAVPAAYFGVLHQRGSLQVMPLLREAIPNNSSSITFLMPCHSTPLYSHLHVNVTTRYLKCEPPLNKSGEVTEAEAFFNNPQRWWRAEYSSRQPPTLLVLFDRLKGRVESLLGGYTLIHDLPHTQFPEGEVGEKVLVYRKVERQPLHPNDEVV